MSNQDAATLYREYWRLHKQGLPLLSQVIDAGEVRSREWDHLVEALICQAVRLD